MLSTPNTGGAGISFASCVCLSQNRNPTGKGAGVISDAEENRRITRHFL